MLQIGMPDANSFKAGSACSFYSILEIIGAYFPFIRKFPCGCSEQIHEFNIVLHRQSFTEEGFLV